MCVFAVLLFFLFSQNIILPAPAIAKETLSIPISSKHSDWISKELNNQELQWWSSYKKALTLKNDSKLFCDRMYSLVNVPFPLKHYAKLYHYSHCHESTHITRTDFPKWMQKKVAKAWYEKSKSLKDQKEIMESAYYLYQLLSEKNQKEQYLIHALRIAKQQQDPRTLIWTKQLYQLSPRYIKKPTLSQMLSVANDFRKNRQLKKAALYYRQLLNTPEIPFYEKNNAFKWMRWIYKDRHNTKKYLIATYQWKRWLKKEMNKHPQAIQFYHNISIMFVRTQWTLGHPRKALRTLNQIEKELKNRFSLFEIYRLKGFIFEELGKINPAIYFFQKSLKEKTLNLELKEKTWWQYGWVLYRAGKIQKSITTLTKLLEQTQNQYLQARILFWTGRLWAIAGNHKKSKQSYQQLIKTDPVSYYGLLAHYDTKKEIKIKKTNIRQKLGNSKEYSTARWLLSLGEHDDVHDFLQYKAEEYRKDNKQTNRTELFYYMALAKYYLPLFQMAGSLPLKERSAFFQSYAEILFPITYRQEVETAAQLFNIEKELIYALIRQESAYNPKARSPSDAFGLMQVRPLTAKYIAKQAGIRYRSIRDLYHPKKNILLGTAFLKKQFKHYDFQFIVTIASYNAGGTAIRRWLKQRPITDPLSFIEDIPFNETRIYVMLLIRNFIFYKLLIHPERKITFPHWILHIQPPKGK